MALGWSAFYDPPVAEMPTFGNLKSGDSFFCITPPNLNDQPTCPLPPPPPSRDKHNLIQSLIGLEHYMKSHMRYRPTQLAFMMVIANLSLSVMKYVRKYPRKRTLNQIKFEFWEKMLGENGINSKLKRRKAHNSILSGRFGDLYGRPGDCCRIRESWHVCCL